MEGQVIGFFNNRPDADQARDALEAAGFRGSEIDIFEPGRGHEGSWMDRLKEFFGTASDQDRQIYAEAVRRGEVAVAVDADNDDEVSLAADILERHHAVDLEGQIEEWRAQGWSGATTQSASGIASQAAQPTGATQEPAEGEQTVPVTEEQLRIGKREIRKGGVRIHTRVTENPVEEDVQLREEHARVERRPVDRPLQPGEQPFQERTIEVTESTEEPVVSKQARVVEEVAIHKDVQERTEKVRDTVRRTDVDIENLSPDERTRWADSYVEDLSRDPRYAGSDWDVIQTDVRSDFERRYPGQSWERFSDSIRQSYYERRRRGA